MKWETVKGTHVFSKKINKRLQNPRDKGNWRKSWGKSPLKASYLNFRIDDNWLTSQEAIQEKAFRYQPFNFLNEY